VKGGEKSLKPTSPDMFYNGPPCANVVVSSSPGGHPATRRKGRKKKEGRGKKGGLADVPNARILQEAPAAGGRPGGAGFRGGREKKKGGGRENDPSTLAS